MDTKSRFVLTRKTLYVIVILAIFSVALATLGLQSAKAYGIGAQAPIGILVRLSASKASFGTSEDVILHVIITNPGSHSIRLLKWFTPIEGIERPLFTVLRAGQPVAYLGMLVKRAAPTGQDYITLAAGKSLDYKVNLSAYYDLSASGNYEVNYNVTSSQLFAKQVGQQSLGTNNLTSNTLRIFVEGRAARTPSPIRAQVVTGTTSFNSCSTSQQTDLLAARTNASTYASDAVAYFTASKNGLRYTTWFGVYDLTRYNTVSSHYTALRSAMDTASINFDCSLSGCSSPSWYAYVYHNSPYNIYLCNAFWAAPLTGTDSKAGTLIHETSHFDVVAATADHVYGQTAAKALAISDPDQAIQNADSHEYFAENNPPSDELYILSPTGTAPGYAGSNASPSKMIVKVDTSHGLSISAFSIKIGSNAATVIIAQEISGIYTLEIMPPVQSSNGMYDLQVTVGTLTDTKVGAVKYAAKNNVDVDLVIDRSGSMGGDPIAAAQDAAEQFVDFMQNNDMVGVVSFDDVVETNFPLTTIQSSPSPAPPVFSDDMESGAGNWVADSPWGLTTESAHSGAYSWTDSPGGNYADNSNVSLRTASAINIPTSISTPVLAFWQKYNIETYYDHGYVEASTDGGSNWTTLTSYTGSDLTWHRVEVSLSSYSGQDVLLRFRLYTDYSVTYDGWYIDDVAIGESISDTKTSAKNAIEALYARNSTSIGGGLQQGQEQLATLGSPTHPWAIVLLTDGLENTPPWVADVLPTIKASKTNVYTIGLGTYADQALLLDIASQTGGTYNYAPGPEQLSGIYNTILGAVTDQQTLFAETGVAQQGVTDQKSVVVDSTVSEATFSINWSNSASDIDLTLGKPDGTIIDPTTAAGDPNIEYIAGSTYKYYRIYSPTLVSGTWQINITGGSISAKGKGVIATASGEPYIARVTAAANLTLHAYLGQNDYLTTEPVKMIVTLSDNQPILGATVTASVETPSQALSAARSDTWIEFHGDTIPDPAVMANNAAMAPAAAATITLFDDGLHGDGIAGDGIYANQFSDTDQVGTYVFTFLASGTSNLGGAFTRQSQLSSYIAQNPNPTISGNAGVPNATLSYTDVTPQIATADDNGDYAFIVSYGWSGTVTPSKPGYTFSPDHRTYNDVTANLTDENYTALVTISGNTEVGGATLNYTGGSTDADDDGNYTVTVPYNWSGTITPSKAGCIFSPDHRDYFNVTANLAGENYIVFVTISGNVGVGGVSLNYDAGTTKAVISHPDGSYSITVPYNWSGIVTPSKPNYTFPPTQQIYINLHASQVNQNFTATPTPFTISGYAGAPGVILTYVVGGVTKTVISDQKGNYTLTVPYGWSGTVTPSLACVAPTTCSFIPSNRYYSKVHANQVNQNYTLKRH